MSLKKLTKSLGIIICLLTTFVSGAQIGPPPTYYKIQKQTFRYTDMTAGATKTLNVRGSTPMGSFCMPPDAAITPNIKRAKLKAEFNWNSDFLATNTTTYNLTYTITAYATFTGVTSVVATYTASNLKISNLNPTAYAEIDFTSLHTIVNRFDVKAAMVTTGGAPDPLVNANLFSDVYFTEEFIYDVTSPSGTKAINLQNVSITGDNLVKFSWVSNCPDNGSPPNYQFQLLRLYNNNPSLITDERIIRANVNWDEALSIETGNSLKEISLTIAEGTGYYLWRVRPIGNAYEGGIANDRNWGQWATSPTYVSGNHNISTGSAPYLFYFSYNQWDFYNPSSAFNTSSYPGSTYNVKNDGDRNWIFNRNFVEGDANTKGQVNIGEGIGYANRLQMAGQKQSRITSEQKKVISQSIYDYSGRAALQTLPTPVAKNTLSYEPVFVKNATGGSYSAYDFDRGFSAGWAPANNYKDPSAMDSVVVPGNVQGPSSYYSSNNLLESMVPTAAGFPFSRTLFSKDGKNTAIETSMAGKEHKLTSSPTKHTTRVMESGVADMEIVRIFGDEAPDESSVYKTISIDQNNIASVAYISKEGKTIATCLSGTGTANMDPLPSSAVSPFTVSLNINSSNTSSGPFSFRSFKTLGLTETTNISLNYGLTPNTYSDPECYSACQTCDYKIILKVTDNNDDMSPVVMTFTMAPPATACSPTSIATTTVITLPPGVYTIERIIETNTSPSGSSTTYINSFIATAQAAITASLTTGTGTLVDDAGVPTGGTVSMTTFFSYLGAQNLSGLYSLIGATTGDTHKNIKIGCNTLRVPIWPCSYHTCTGSDLDFEAYFYTQLGISPIDNTAKLAALTNMFNGVGYSLGDFNIVIQNMLNAGYTCDQLWNCWQGTVAYYMAMNNPANPMVAGSVSMPGTGTTFSAGPPNYLDNFLNCAGYQITTISSTPGSGVCPESSGGYFTHPYKYFKYTTQCCACETAFVNSYTSCTVTPSPSPGYSCVAIGTFTTWFNAVNTINLPCAATGTDVVSNNKAAFFKCLINNMNGSSTPGACSLIAPSSTAAIAAGTGTALVNACKDHCEGLFNEFVSQNISLYHSQGLSVQDDKWNLVLIDGAYYNDTILHTPSGSDIPLHDVYCRATILVNACKSKCQITVQSDGSLGSPTEIATIQNIFTGQFVIAAPATSEPFCEKGFSQASMPSPADSTVRMIVRILNNKLNTLRATTGADGTWWDFKTFLNSVSTSLATFLSSSTTQSVFVHPSFPSYFSIIPGSGSGKRVVYYFNYSQGSDATIPANDIYSIPTVASSANFIYTAMTTSVVGGSTLPNIIASTNPAYIFSSAFVPVLPSSTTPGTCISVVNALADAMTNPTPMFVIDTTTLLKTYNNPLGVKGYWIYDVSGADISGSYEQACKQVICYKLQPAVVPEGADILDFSPPSCEAQTISDIANSVNGQVSDVIQNYAIKMRNLYYQQCVTNLIDTYTANYSLGYHHYTLYYYDRAGNVVKTVPPAGVTYTSTNRLTDHPNHTFITEYAYNSLAQVVRCKTPDGGQTIFFYDAKGKLRFSQNAKQALANKYSYTKYDPLTRIVEVGEFTSGIVPTQANCNNPAYPLTGGQEITKTIYNVPVPGLTYFGGKTQRFLQNRMSYSLSDKDGNTSTLNDQVVTYYSYDPHGNVEWMIQDIPELGRNYIAYEYDLISGSVVKVKYNETYDDKFFHRYTYDSDKRIQTVETSYDGIFWEKDAAYSYYLHGPVKRAAIGHDKIQGIDYVYTINSWLKSLNGLNRVADPGGDGALLDGNMAVPRDAYAMVLGYFNNDYNNRTSLLNSGNGINLSGTNLYNGNISSWSSNNDPKAMSAAMSSGVDYSTIMTGRTFKYDQLNRITGSDFKTLSAFGAPWTNLNDYKETFSYDANGNIINLFRNGRSASLSMDNLTYHYYTETGSTYVPNLSAPASATNLTNRLAYVTDAVVSTYTNDIDNQTNTSNYTYDAIGNLTADASESITAINWNVYGKISDITKVKAGVTTVISFMYDAAGNRVYKKVTNSSSPVTGDVTTYYVKDAAGNVMGTYERKNSGSSPNYVATFALKEQPLYGSDRLGLQHREFERSIGYVSPANPTVQLTPVGVHTSSYPFIMLPLSNTTQKQLYNRDINTNSSTAIVLSGNENLQTVSGASPTITYQHGRTQAVAYDEFGNVALSLYSYSVFTSGAFTSNSSVLFVRDKTPVILSGLNNSPNGQAAFMKVPGSDNQYYFFTIGTNGKAYYHVIEASTGAMMSSNNELDANTDYGNTMALFEDRTGQGNSTLYLRRFAASTSSLALFSITEGGIAALTPTSISTAVSSSGDGEIVISPTGNKLAVVTNTSASNSEIKVYTLGANHQSLAFSASRGFAGNSKSLEFTDNDVSVFYTSRVGTTTTLLRLPVATLASAAPVTMHTQLTSTITSAVRKGVNGKMYYLNNLSGVTTSTLSMFTNPDAATTSVTSVMTTVLATGNMPMQPHLLSYSTPTTNVTSHIRELDRKEYELKDHLGNVHTTVKDYKVPFVTGSPDVAYRETFNAGTTGGFVALVSPAGTIVDNISNRMRVYGLSAGAAAQKIVSLPAGAGQYLLSFDYDAGTCSTAQFDITNLTPGDGFTKGGMQITGSYNHIIKVPTGMSTLDLRFEYQDATSGKQFYIDNILVKKVDEVATLTIGTVASENFSSPSNWVPTNTLIDYSAANMKISKDPAAVGSVFSAAKSVNLLQGQMYKITFDVTSVAMGTSSLSLVYENDNNTTLLLDYNTPLKNTATGSYTYYVTPVTNSGNVMYYINNPSGSFTCNIDNFKIDNVSIAVQPMYTSVMNNMNDYYAFGSPMPGRNYVGATDYKYGMNGMEKIDEVTSNGRTYDFGDRIYDTDLARFNSGDPLSCVFPWQSPYAYALNSPITYLDDQGGGPCKPLISMISPLLKNTLSGVRSFVHSLVALIGDKPLSKRDVFEVKSNGHRGKNFTGIYNIVPGQSTFWYNDYYEYDHIQIWTTGENPTLLWESGKDDDRKKDGEFYVATGKDPQYSGKPEDISDRQLMNGGWASYQIPADYPSSVTIKVITNNLDPENYKYDFDSNRDGSKSVWNFYIRNPKASNTSSEKKEKKEKRVREKKKKKENRGSHMNVRFL